MESLPECRICRRPWSTGHTCPIEPPGLPPAIVVLGYHPPGTEAWAHYQMAHRMTADDAQAVEDLVAAAMKPHPSLWRVRTEYAKLCHERHWSGFTARLIWSCLEALLKDPMDDDIPF